jgi:molybdate transport system ATP-binding protein
MNSAPDQRVRARFQLDYPGFSLELDLDLPGRGVTALYGPSGSGKTSCLRTLAGLTRCDRAAHTFIAVNGEVWQDDAKNVWVPVHQRALGYVFQDAALFKHLNVAQNMAFGMTRVPQAQRRVSLEQAVALLGLGHLMERHPDTLSGGERQRVAIARALATSPRILLMDEPLAALDAARKAEVLPYLEQLHRELDIPVLYVSHALEEVARLADHLVLLEAGRVVASGPTAELLTRLDLSLAHGDGAGAVMSTTIVGHAPGEHLTTTRFSGGDLIVPQQAGAVGSQLRIRVQARDVSLTLTQQTGTSILNILHARVTELSPDHPGQMMVALDVGGCPLLARVTSRSARELGLRPGLVVYAQIKGVAILGG